MRSTGNRGIEAIHSVLCGASPNLPITSGNLTFQDFLSRMNKVVHMKSAEHALRQIPGNTVTYTKKKKITYAAKCLEQPSQLQDTYQKPSSYQQFSDDLKAACERGDSESKSLIQKLVPYMMKLLKEREEWDCQKLSIHMPEDGLLLVTKKEDLSKDSTTQSNNVYDELISISLDKHHFLVIMIHSVH